MKKEKLPFEEILLEGRPNLDYTQLKANLAVPISKDLVSQLPKKGKSGSTMYIDYVNITDLKDILDTRVSLWTAHIKSSVVMGQDFGVVITLRIYAADGIWEQDGNGLEELNHRIFGDTYSNAYAQAFRRACEGHGLGRELWRKDEVRQNEYESTYTEKPNSASPNTQPQQRQVSSPQDKMTDKQASYLENMCVEMGLNIREECKKRMNKEFDNLTRTDASNFIKSLSGKP